MLSLTEENYLKALVQIILSDPIKRDVGTNELAAHLQVKPASVSDMLKKLKEKELVHYQKYGKISLLPEGEKLGLEVIRKHRLWETFLFEKLEFAWDEVHEVAEQLEHIQSKKLIDSIDKLLNYPRFDPHGDAIPNKDGEITIPYRKLLSELEPGKECRVIAVKDNSQAFLQYVDKLGLKINDTIQLIDKEEFDESLTIRVSEKSLIVSNKFAENLFVVCTKCQLGKDCARNQCGFN